MKGNEERLVEFMDGSKKRFVIPVYQRNYDWKQENCKQLFDDLVKVETSRRKTHFFGSIVSVYQPSGRTTEFLVVDGQQRLTTVSLLLLAIYNLLKSGKVTFRFHDVEYRTDSWTTIARQVLTLLAKESAEKLRSAAAKSSTIRLALQKTETLMMEEFAPGIYACCHGSVWEKCNVMKQAVSEYPNLVVDVVFSNPIEDEDDE